MIAPKSLLAGPGSGRQVTWVTGDQRPVVVALFHIDLRREEDKLVTLPTKPWEEVEHRHLLGDSRSGTPSE